MTITYAQIQVEADAMYLLPPDEGRREQVVSDTYSAYVAAGWKVDGR